MPGPESLARLHPRDSWYELDFNFEVANSDSGLHRLTRGIDLVGDVNLRRRHMNLKDLQKIRKLLVHAQVHH